MEALLTSLPGLQPLLDKKYGTLVASQVGDWGGEGGWEGGRAGGGVGREGGGGSGGGRELDRWEAFVCLSLTDQVPQ